LVACSTSTTEQLAALHAAAVFMKAVSAHRQPKSLGEHADDGTVARTHFDYGWISLHRRRIVETLTAQEGNFARNSC
jgi:hypothetical protein